MENCETPRAAAAVAAPSPCGAQRSPAEPSGAVRGGAGSGTERAATAGAGGTDRRGSAGLRDGAVRCGGRDGTGRDRMEQDGMGWNETGRCGLRDGAVRAAGGGSAAFRPCPAWSDAALTVSGESAAGRERVRPAEPRLGREGPGEAAAAGEGLAAVAGAREEPPGPVRGRLLRPGRAAGSSARTYPSLL